MVSIVSGAGSSVIGPMTSAPTTSPPTDIGTIIERPPSPSRFSATTLFRSVLVAWVANDLVERGRRDDAVLTAGAGDGVVTIGKLDAEAAG